MICAIHQPNFFPWLGYFDKIRKADKFVFLDHVQFPKTGGGTWSNRVAFNIQAKSKWITAPINRPNGLLNTNEITFQNTNWRDKMIKTLSNHYSKTENFKIYKDFVFDLIAFENNNLAQYNINAITKICQILNIDTKNKFTISSSLKHNTASNQLLIDITKTMECNTYMAGGGASGYQNLNMFKVQEINFLYQNFLHPVYKQANTENFIMGLSVIDYLFNSYVLKNN